jgi:hypothetical protein
MEQLEDRLVPSTVNWTGAVNNDWGNPNNWDVRRVPGPDDDAFINVNPAITIQHTGGDDSLASLHSQNPIDISGGSLAIASLSTPSDADTLKVSGGLATLSIDDTNLTVHNLIHTNGTVTGTGTLTIDNQWTWTSGSMVGTGDTGRTVLTNTANATLSGGFFSMLKDREVDNSGSATVMAGDAIDFNGETAWKNLAGSQFTLQSGASLGNFFAIGNFQNSGTLTVASPAATSNIDIPLLNMGMGMVDVQAGTLNVNARGGHSSGNIQLDDRSTLNIGDAFTLNAGATVTGTGTVQVATFKTLNVAGDVSIPNLNVTGGTVTTVVNLAVDNLMESGGNMNGPGKVTINTQWTWTGGNVTGPGHTVLMGNATLSAGALSLLADRTVDNMGTATALNGGFSFNNHGVWNNQPGSMFILMNNAVLGNFFAGPTAQFNNAGVLQKIGTGPATIGVSVVNSGELILGQCGDAGTLTINGNYTQTASGILTIVVGGPTAGVDFTQLQVSGQATLDGLLNASFCNGVTPGGHRILSCGSRSGQFAASTVTETYFPNGVEI